MPSTDHDHLDHIDHVDHLHTLCPIPAVGDCCAGSSDKRVHTQPWNRLLDRAHRKASTRQHEPNHTDLP